MKNAFLRFGYTCATTFMAAGLLSTSAWAASENLVTVTLPEPVTVGLKVLPAGQYTISDDVRSGVFMIRSDRGDHAALMAQRLESEKGAENTEVVLSDEGGTFKLDKLFIKGSTVGYEFRK